jgi:hypothetical protein
VAEWVALANGHHEIPLYWHRDFPDEPVSGYDEHTVLVLDVTVLEGSAVRFSPDGCAAGHEELHARIELSTADGALS